MMSDITITLNKRQSEVLNTLLSAEIMKLDLHYGTQKNTERQSVCYSIRDKLIESEKEHEQLEELKAYKEIGTVKGYKEALRAYTEEYQWRKELQTELDRCIETIEKIQASIRSNNRERVVEQLEDLLIRLKNY